MAARVSEVPATPPAASRDLFAMMKAAAESRNAPLMYGEANISRTAVVANKDPAKPLAASPEQFATLMAAVEVNGLPFVDYEANINRAAMVAAETPVVLLPDRKACRECPFFGCRGPADLTRTDTDAFDDFLATVGEDPAVLVGAPPPKILMGVDLGQGPHEPVAPGYEDLARILDPTVLTDALFYNGTLPECACTRALFDAAASDFFAGVRLDFLRQAAAQKQKKATHAPLKPHVVAKGVGVPASPS